MLTNKSTNSYLPEQTTSSFYGSRLLRWLLTIGLVALVLAAIFGDAMTGGDAFFLPSAFRPL
ncbi:MAG: hypothetical protein R3E79_44770 [Caldilineaceae bacterium]